MVALARENIVEYPVRDNRWNSIPTCGLEGLCLRTQSSWLQKAVWMHFNTKVAEYTTLNEVHTERNRKVTRIWRVYGKVIYNFPRTKLPTLAIKNSSSMGDHDPNGKMFNPRTRLWDKLPTSWLAHPATHNVQRSKTTIQIHWDNVWSR